MDRKLNDGNINKNSSYHSHELCGITEFSDRHQHEFTISVIRTLGKGPLHYHIFEGSTSIEDGHRHILYGQTGPAQALDTQNHIHSIQCKSSVNNKHSHIFRGNIL